MSFVHGESGYGHELHRGGRRSGVVNGGQWLRVSDIHEQVLVSECYEKIAACLKVVWESFAKRKWAEAETFKELGQSIRDAKEVEKQGIALVKTYLNLNT